MTVVMGDVANKVDDLCMLIARTDALVNALECFCDGVIQGDDGRRRFEHLSHFVTMTAETVRVAKEISGELALLCLSQIQRQRQPTSESVDSPSAPVRDAGAPLRSI